jgi:Response regulators consisting of a CheY-like receiver domain and a winged-helix DNA-binding domain
MAKILIVEDDLAVCGVIESWLTFERHVVECAQTGEHALQLLAEFPYDAIILDWGLPDTSGIEVLREFRSKGGRTPVLLLTGKGSVREKEEGLDGGADDYLTKPFDVKELSARVRALLRRPSTYTTDVLTVGDLSLDQKTCEVTKGGEKLKLYPKDYALLEFFMRNPNVVFSSDALIDRVWKSDQGVASDTVRSTIKRLRKAIDTEGQPSPIENVHGVGYLFRASKTES